MTDTIAAIATPYGSGGIGVIRISGPRAFEISSKIFSKARRSNREEIPADTTAQLESRRVTHGFILDGQETIDEVLLLPMKGPASYTAEDVVEIQAHSGTIVLRRILDLLFSHGVRPADPGEFTKRAFLNGRIDLTQAEAVADIINARSTSTLKFASAQNLGTLRDDILGMTEFFTGLLARLEAAIDFPDEVTPFEFTAQDRLTLDQILDRCRDLIQKHQDANFLKAGIRVAICGEPNVGKSSLMNRLLDKERSIITAIPGTTRDPIEEGLNIQGIPFVVVDTAGIHDTDDLVEIIGIGKAKDHIEAADIILYMTEAGRPFCEKAFTKTIPQGKKVIHVINKIDLAENSKSATQEAADAIPTVEISALADQGIDRLRQCLMDTCIRDLDMETDAVIPNLRHKNALVQALAHMEDIQAGMESGQEEEILALDVKNSIESLGLITGETASIDILDAIFNNFCIGK